jgi:DNA repair protein RecO (recombination protein O)
MLQETTAIVLNNKKYGETSCIVTMLTRKFGVQTYLINGIRKNSSKSAGNAMYFQPANILTIVAYHNNLKHLQRLKTYNYYVIYNAISQHVLKSMVALFITELLYITLKQPEENTDIYDYAEDVFKYLDSANNTEAANLPLFFLIHLSSILGFVIQNNYNSKNTILNLQDGLFEPHVPPHNNYALQELSQHIAHLLQMQHPSELTQLIINQTIRRNILEVLLQFFALHLPGFSYPKTLFVLKEVLS